VLVSLDLVLSQKAEQLCKIEGINYKALEPIETFPYPLQVPDMQAFASVPSESSTPKKGSMWQVRQSDLVHQFRQVRQAEEKNRLHAVGLSGGEEKYIVTVLTLSGSYYRRLLTRSLQRVVA